MLKKIRRDCRALSPIFSTLIILAIVFVFFIPVFAWASNMTSTSQNSWQQSGQTATERIVIEEVNLQAGQTTCTVYIRNIGQTAVTINDILISKADGSGPFYAYDKNHNPIQISSSPSSTVQGQLMTVTIANLGSFTPQSRVAYRIQAFTTQGVSDTFQVVT